MAPLLRALDPLLKDIALLSSTHMQILTICLSGIRESSVLFWVLQALQTHGVDIYASKTPIHRTYKIKNTQVISLFGYTRENSKKDKNKRQVIA